MLRNYTLYAILLPAAAAGTILAADFALTFSLHAANVEPVSLLLTI